MTDWCRLRIRQGAKGSQSPQLRAFSLALFRFSWHPSAPVRGPHCRSYRQSFRSTSVPLYLGNRKRRVKDDSRAKKFGRAGAPAKLTASSGLRGLRPSCFSVLLQNGKLREGGLGLRIGEVGIGHWV